MNRASLASFAQSAASQRGVLFGVVFSFRGAEVRGTIAVRREALELDRGGFRSNPTATIRLPVSVSPVPEEQEVITEVATGKVWTIVAHPLTNFDNPLAAEHVFDVAG